MKTSKNKFKNVFLMVAATVLAVFLLSFASCTANVDDKEDDKVETPAKDNVEDSGETPDEGGSGENTEETPVINPVIAEAIAKISIPETVEDAAALTLPSSITVDSSSVTVAWSSSDTSIIDNAGHVTPKTGKEEDTVTLTAVFVYNGITETKTYTVKVYQTLKVLVASALKQVTLTYTPSAYVYETITLPSSVQIDGKDVHFTYKSSDKRFVRPYDGNDGLAIIKDLKAKTVKVTAEAKYGEAVATKEFTLEIPAFTNFREDYYKDPNCTQKNGRKEIIFDMENKTITSIRYYETSSSEGKKYSFEFGKEPGQIIATTTAIMGYGFGEPDKWYTMEGIRETIGGMLYQFDALAKNPPETYAALEAELKNIGMENDVLVEFMNDLGANPSDSEDVQKQKIRAFLPNYLQGFFTLYGVKDIEEYIEYGLATMFISFPNGDVCEYIYAQADYSSDKSQIIYPTGGNIFINTLYNNKASWFNQCGRYAYYDQNGKTYSLDCRYGMEITWVGEDVSGSFNDDYTKFTSAVDEEHPNSVEYTITDHKDGTVTVEVGGNSYILEFEGCHL